eukprot:591388-Rhodomonas_salina.1
MRFHAFAVQTARGRCFIAFDFAGPRNQMLSREVAVQSVRKLGCLAFDLLLRPRIRCACSRLKLVQQNLRLRLFASERVEVGPGTGESALASVGVEPTRFRPRRANPAIVLRVRYAVPGIEQGYNAAMALCQY